jgi:hypothetical protein
VSEAQRELAEAFADLSDACLRVSEALLAAAKERPVAAATSDAPARKRARQPAQPEAELSGLESRSPTRRKIMVALAQFGRPMNMPQLGIYTGLSHVTGSFKQEIARLRRDGCVDGPGSALVLTGTGRAELGEFAQLPEGSQLFEFWCSKLGGTAAQLLRALRKQQAPMSMAELGAAAALSHQTGSFKQAVAKLRRMDVIEGKGTALQLTSEIRRALEPTVRVFDTSSGQTHRMNTKGHVR